MKINAFTPAVLACRKILMHVAVEKGAKKGESFVSYVNYLDSAGYIPPDGNAWVERLKTKGNEADHEIVIMTHDDAKLLLDFAEMLLKSMYEFPERLKESSPPRPHWWPRLHCYG
jgi:hypothetical protein